MAVSSRTKIYRVGGIQFNMAPLIDIVFLLIIFFMLVNQFVGVENAPVDLPGLTEGEPELRQPEDKVVVTLRHVEGLDRPIYQIGPVAVRSLERLAARLAQVKSVSPEVQMILRADRRLAYKHIRRVMLMASRHGIQTVQIAVAVGQPESS